MAHPPYSWFHLANDYGWLTFLVIALVFAFRSNIPARKIFIALTVLVLSLRILGDGTLTLVMGIGLSVASVQGLQNKRSTRVR